MFAIQYLWNAFSPFKSGRKASRQPTWNVALPSDLVFKTQAIKSLSSLCVRVEMKDLKIDIYENSIGPSHSDTEAEHIQDNGSCRR